MLQASWIVCLFLSLFYLHYAVIYPKKKDAMKEEKYFPVLIAFNPTDLARNVKVEEWDKTFFGVVEEMKKQEREGKAAILNPIVGPGRQTLKTCFSPFCKVFEEPITGSTRMKGGTATKLILEMIFFALMARTKSEENSLVGFLSDFQKACTETYSSSLPSLSAVIEEAGEAVKKGGRLVYISEKESVGMLAMIDSSECPPTFGSSPGDVQAFVRGGWKKLFQQDFFLTKKEGSESLSKIELNEFEPRKGDCVIWVSVDEEACEELKKVIFSSEKIGAKTFRIHFQFSSKSTPKENETWVLLSEPSNKVWTAQVLEMSVKWTLNAISTCAHIIKGKVYENRMMDLSVSNNKLYFRSISIISKFANVESCVAEDCLLRSIYLQERVSEEVRQSQISER